jgi:signal transduction histidine kinase
MPTIVPESARPVGPVDLVLDLSEGLTALLDFIGAEAGWIGLIAEDGRLTFPVRQGEFPDAWLDLQMGLAGSWGFGMRAGPTLLNDLSALNVLGAPAMSNLLSCPLSLADGRPTGQLAAANKRGGFTSHDASVIQGIAHWIGRRAARAGEAGTSASAATAILPRNTFDRLADGVLVFDETGRLLFANAAWLQWTGYQPDELLGRDAPFPFWIKHDSLVQLGLTAPWALAALPFRRRDDVPFWCRVESVAEDLNGRNLTVAILRRVPAPQSTQSSSPRRDKGAPATAPAPVDLPFAAALTDRQGRVVWANDRFCQEIAPSTAVVGTLLRDRFSGISSAALQAVAEQVAAQEGGRIGRLILEPIGPRDRTKALVAFWTTLALPTGTGFFFGFSEDWAELGSPDAWAMDPVRLLRQPIGENLALLLTAGGEVAFWDERWQRRTGLAERDLTGVPVEVVLDWLFPRQIDRDRVADFMQQTGRPAGQFILDVTASDGARASLCTFIPLPKTDSRRWLLLVGDPDNACGLHASARTFLRGLAQLVSHFVLTPQGLAESALERADLTPEMVRLFEQIVQHCQGMGRLLNALQDLAAGGLPSAEEVSLPALVREFLHESASSEASTRFQVRADPPEHGFAVRANRRMLKTVLGHLFDNARQALSRDEPGHIAVSVFETAEFVGCSITDNGEGLPTDDWPLLLAPFTSTKGPFARDARHAALDAVGLGLSVCRHLLALHGGRIELRSPPEGGTSALFFLPRAQTAIGPRSPGDPIPVRTDAPSEAGGPHAVPDSTPAPSSSTPHRGK